MSDKPITPAPPMARFAPRPPWFVRMWYGISSLDIFCIVWCIFSSVGFIVQNERLNDENRALKEQNQTLRADFERVSETARVLQRKSASYEGSSALLNSSFVTTDEHDFASVGLFCIASAYSKITSVAIHSPPIRLQSDPNTKIAFRCY